MTCTSCTAMLPANAAYCGECGERVRTRRDTLTGILLDGRFHIDAKIAAGGFGAVYRATRISTGTVVALKVLHSDLAHDRNLSARFRREALALSRLRDPHTVTTYEFGAAPDGTLFIVMELLRGTSLFERFRSQGPLAWRRMVSIALGVCSSLSEAHHLGIVHRDLKPANIHLERGDYVKVLDFGIAKVLDTNRVDDERDLTRVGQAIGTIEYMSPEQLVGSDCDGRTDIYTLGIVMYEMITGRRPFADATGPTSLVTALMTRTPVPPSKLFGACLPTELDRILLRCLEREPSRRFADIDELAAALERVLAIHPERTTAPRAKLPGSGHVTMFASYDEDDEITTVDLMPPIAEPPTVRAKTPHLDSRPRLPELDSFAVGSSIDLLPNDSPEIWLLVLLTSDASVALAFATLL
jgi:serine/threonine protein kinase